MVNNNCTKGGANCTNALGSFNCTCQTKYFWNGIECEGLFSIPLFDKIFKPIRNSRLSGSVWLSEPSFFRLFVCPCVRHSAFLLKGWNRPLPSSRTSVIWCRNYGVRTRLRAKSPSSVYRIKSRANERKFPETGC